MKRIKSNIDTYIKGRISQLKEDKLKINNKTDIMWYNRCIQELDWTLQMNNKPTHNCFMSKHIYV
jgi:hypothetical protein